MYMHSVDVQTRLLFELDPAAECTEKISSLHDYGKEV
jgi:hypothetical protein